MRRASYSRHVDWYALTNVEAAPLWNRIGDSHVPLPGVKHGQVAMQAGAKPGEVLVHRSMLPLLDPALVAAELLEQPGDWIARDARFKALGITLRTTQHSAVDFIQPRRGVLLGDSMRLGKTLSCIASHDPARGPLVIVGPLSTRPVWLGWIRRVFPGVPVSVLTGRKADPAKLKAPIIWAHYDVISSWQALFPIGTLVFDEAHALINHKNKRAQAAALLASRAAKVIAATGTPVWNLPAGLWSIIGMLAPGAWGSHFEFGYRYGAPVHNGYATEFTGISNESELRSRLTQIMIRRQWRDVADEVPPISRNILVAEVDEKLKRKLDILAGRLKTERTNTAANLAIYRAAVAEVKVGVVAREAANAYARKEPIVVWTWHVDLAKKLAAKLETPFLLHGDVSQTRRETLIETWKTTYHPLVATMSVAREGLDFSHSRLPIFAELDYTPAIIAQAEMRTFDPTRPMNVTFTIANHFVDHKIVQALIHKLGASSPLGLDAATDAIEALREAFEGPRIEPDMDAFLSEILATEFDYA